MKPLDIEERFQGYIKKVYPFGWGKIQETELRRAFYAGIHLLLNHMLSFANERDGDKELERILAATMAFARSVGDSINRN